MNGEFHRQVIAVAKTVQEMQQVKTGALFVAMSATYPEMTIRRYRRILDFVTRAGMVREENHVLYWIGGEFRLGKISEV